MATVSLRVRGRATATQAWERYAVPAAWAGWAPQIQRVDSSTPRLEAGTTGTVHAGLLPVATVPVPFEVLEVDEAARVWVWRVRVGPVRLELEHGVQDDVAGCATTLLVRGPLPVVAAYAPLARLALTRLVKA